MIANKYLKNKKFGISSYSFIFGLLVIGFFTLSMINPKSQTKSYAPGEYLQYSLSYGFITAGQGVMEVKDTLMDGKHLHQVIARGETTGLSDALFKVRDRYESFINPVDYLPKKSVRSIREGRYTYYDEVIYNHDSSYVVSQKTGVQKVPSRIQDILSAFYFARNFKFNDDLKKDEIIEIMTYFSNELFPLRFRYKGIDNIKTKFGRIECYKFSPVTEVGRSFASDDDMEIWISRDGNRIPIKIRFDLKVGSFTCELASFKNLVNPFSSIRN